ncbi:unannotated protein [freshwater metagenome]|uniref:Unannotated protein n=1 Tax=freshwater metagenome TaxID=449393 RepID=A0A6J7IH36_9ZZZZ
MPAADCSKLVALSLSAPVERSLVASPEVATCLSIVMASSVDGTEACAAASHREGDAGADVARNASVTAAASAPRGNRSANSAGSSTTVGTDRTPLNAGAPVPSEIDRRGFATSSSVTSSHRPSQPVVLAAPLVPAHHVSIALKCERDWARNPMP